MGLSVSTRGIVLTALCAALYAAVGYLLWLGAQGPGGIMFWPAVIVPAVFSIVFSPWIGGAGAAIGIFIADVTYHHVNPLQSLIVGVPANFLGFYILGYVARRAGDTKTCRILAIAIQFVPLLILVVGYLLNYVDTTTFVIYFVTALIVTIAIPIQSIRKVYVPANQLLAYALGLLVGALYIGLTLWPIQKLLNIATLPSFAPAFFGYFLWVYYTEIPFLNLVTPYIVKAIEKRYGG